MATLKQRLHRKNSSGGYDVIHLETSSDLVKMTDGTTLTSKISSMDTTINGKAASDHTHSNATTSAAGFMTGAMVTKLNGIAAGANVYSHPTAKQCNYSYTHPSTKQCNYSVDTSGFATTAQLNEVKTSVSIPSGIIAMWSGASNAIPTGWLLCNGSNGTPDLRNRFILGAGSSYSVGATGGEATHTLTVNEMPSHKHSINITNGYGVTSQRAAGGDSSSGYARETSAVGGGQAHNNMPPYYALCFIMKQ